MSGGDESNASGVASSDGDAIRAELTRLRQELAEATAERDAAMAGLDECRADLAAREADLAEARQQLEAANASVTEAVARTTSELREENEELEEHLTQLVKEVGQLKGGVERIQLLETEGRHKDIRIHELEGEIGRLRSAVASGRPTAMAAASAITHVHHHPLLKGPRSRV